MSIAIITPGSFTIETYGGLISYISDVLDREDLNTQIPKFIHLAGYRLDRMLTPLMRQGEVILTTSTATAALPTDYKQLVTASISGVPLEQVSPSGLQAGWNGAVSGQPRVFSIGNGKMNLAPVPDAAYNIDIEYIKAITPLSDVNPSNWVLQCHADLYVYGGLLQAEAYLSNDDRLAVWKLAFDEALNEANMQGLRSRTGASPLRLRSPVCV